jgi:phosphohistidine phosphatase
MKHLYLLRHAHSLDKGTGFTDKQRELSAVGFTQCMAVSQFILQKKYPIECIISSDATRAVTTTSLIAERLNLGSDSLHFESALYQASIPIIVESVLQFEEVQHILVVGHNPTLSYFAEYFTNEDIGEIPTGTLLFLRFPLQQWKQMEKGKAELIEKFIPD